MKISFTHGYRGISEELSLIDLYKLVDHRYKDRHCHVEPGDRDVRHETPLDCLGGTGALFSAQWVKTRRHARVWLLGDSGSCSSGGCMWQLWMIRWYSKKAKKSASEAFGVIPGSF